MIVGLAFLLATFVVWVAVIATCFLKGKRRLGLALITATAVPVLAMAASLVDELWLSDTLDPGHDEAVEFARGFLIMAWLLFGSLTGLIGLVAAIRPAKLGSWWANRHPESGVETDTVPEPERVAGRSSP